MSDKEENETNSLNDGISKPTEVAETTTNDETPQRVEPASSSETNLPNAEVPPAVTKGKKIEVLLKATGNAPIIVQKKWFVYQEDTIGRISGFLKNYMKLGSDERVLLYINQTFAPAPDQTIKNLYDCYGTDGKLIIHYCNSQAWG